MKKLIYILLILLQTAGAAFCLPACRSKQEGTEPTEESTTGAPEDTDLALIKNGASDYVLVIPQNASEKVLLAANQLQEGIQRLTDVSLPILFDQQVANWESRQTKLILIGNTCLAESESLLEELPPILETYAIDCVDDSIVMISRYDDALLNAVAYYLEELMEANYDAESNTLYFEGCYYEGDTVFSAAFSPKNLASYAIVYSTKVEGYDAVAKMYQEAFEAFAGVTLPIYKDYEKPHSPYEILLGNTDRPLSQKYFADASRIMCYEVIIEKGDMLIAAGGPYSAKKCLYAIQTDLFPFIGTTLKSGGYLKTDLAPVSPAHTAGTTLRIMSSNVLAERASSDPVLPVSQRLEIYCGVLLRYLPDAVGLQEADMPWTTQLPAYLTMMKELDGISYSCLLSTYREREQWEPILYRSDLFDCNDSSYSPAPYWTDETRYLRGVACANFISKEDPTLQFALVNAHWNHTSSAYMYSDALQMAECVKEMQQKHPTSFVFCTGDFNSHYYETKPLYQLLEDISGSIASEVAKESGTLLVPCGCRCHGGVGGMVEGETRPYDEDFIDHVIGAGSFEVLRHDTILTNCTNLMTDHSAIYADVRLPNTKK